MSVHSPSAQLAVLYEHPQWFQPLFAALERRGLSYLPIQLVDHCFDPASREVPAPLILSRVAQSSFLREPEHPIFYAEALLDHWQRLGARVINGADALAINSSKARQLSLITSLGYAVPETRVVHRAKDLLAAAKGMNFPLLVKANIGGSGAGIVRYSSLDELRAAIADRMIPQSVDQVLLVQDYVARAAARSFDWRPSKGIFFTPSKSRVAVTISTFAPRTPASLSPGARPSG